MQKIAGLTRWLLLAERIETGEIRRHPLDLLVGGAANGLRRLLARWSIAGGGRCGLTGADGCAASSGLAPPELRRSRRLLMTSALAGAVRV